MPITPPTKPCRPTTSQRWSSLVAFLFVLAFLPACRGEVSLDEPNADSDVSSTTGGSPDDGAPSGSEGSGDLGDPSTPEPQTPPTPLRRLSVGELDRTVTDLFGIELRPSRHLGPGWTDGGFENDIHRLTVLPPVLTDLITAMESVANEVLSTERLADVIGCEVSSEDAAATRRCVESYAEDLLPRAYRRPATADELDAALRVYDEARTLDYTPREAIAFMLQRILLSPSFLYRVELGNGIAAPHDDHRELVDGYEMASRLSYFLWGTMPDDELFEAAASGALDTADGIEAQARRMLRTPEGEPHPNAKYVVERLYIQWLGLDALSEQPKHQDRHPDWEETLRPALLAETKAFFDDILWSGTISQLLTADHSYLDERLAAHYGIDGVTGDELRRVDLPQAERRGFLTHGSVLARTGGVDGASPIQRGTYVLRRIMCQHMPDPPADVIDSLPEPMEGQTFRERYEELESSESCSGCHTRIHGIGFGLMHYDETGAFVEQLPDGSPVDASGVVVALGEDGTYHGGPELAALLASSGIVEECLIRNLYRFAHGRSETSVDERAIDALLEASRASGGRLEEILVALVRTDDFRSRELITD